MTMIYVARYLHLQLRGKVELERANNGYKHTPELVVESEGFRVLRDFVNGPDSVIGLLKVEGRTSSSLISRQGRPRSSTSLTLEMDK